MDSKAQLFVRLHKSKNLPSLPQVLLKLIEACNNDAIHLSDIAHIIAKDPFISSKVLSLVNSAYFGLNRTFSSLEQAVVYLGANTIKSITVTASVQQVFSKFEKNDQFSMSNFWWNSFSTATYAKKIARKIAYANIEEAYLAGLLQNLGELLLWMNFPKESTALRETPFDNDNTQCDSEKKQIGLTHCEAGSWMVRQWKLNSFIADAILYHHSSLTDIKSAFPLVKIIYLAGLLCHTQDEQYDAVYSAANELFDFGTEQIDSIRDGVQEEVADVAENLGIKITPPAGKVEQDSESAEYEIDLLQQVKNYSLLNGFLENLVQAESKNEILLAIEHAFQILFEIETIFFFLHDFEQQKLYGCGSNANIHSPQLQNLTLSSEQGTSLLVKSMEDQKTILSARDTGKLLQSLADSQLLEAIGGKGMLYIPMVAKKRPVGVIVVGLPDSPDSDIVNSSCSELLHMLANQAAMSLYLEEVKKQQAEKIRTARLVAASMAAAKVVHEVNNPLGIIKNYLKILDMKLPEQDSLTKELNILDEEINRISSIIEQLDDFSTPVKYSIALTDINSLLSNLLQILSKSVFYSSRLKVHFVPNPDLPSIMTDAGAIKQIIINLVKNAAEAMDDGGNVYVETKICSPETTQLPKIENSNTHCIEIIVRDDGPGLPDEIISQLFEPFTSTKGKGHSGLGLSIVQTLVNELKGSVKCSSSEKNGTLFTLTLPIKQRQ